MPALFIGHGSPMNAIEENHFTRRWLKLATDIPRPTAILCISAHWYESAPVAITSAPKLKTIHDFYGFPEELFAVNYTPDGDPALCSRIAELVPGLTLNPTYGIDHGAWSILIRMYPHADIKVLQLSLDSSKSPQWHFDCAQKLSALRDEGVLIIGSGNIVHNLRLLDWYHPQSGHSWVHHASTRIKELILAEDYAQLCNYPALGAEVMQAIPTPEHFLPLLYILGLKTKEDKISFFNDELVMGSLSMTGVQVGE